jgi:hypothetical protein
VFSSGAETDTLRQNKISAVLMEALQMLKFGLKKARLDFTKGWITDKILMAEKEEIRDDILAGILGKDGGAAMDSLFEFLAEGDN